MDPVTSLTEAEAHLAAGRPARALPLLARAARGGGDPFFRADVHHRRAEALRALSRFAAALGEYWAAHKLYRRCGVDSERWRALLGASACLRVLSRYRQADAAWRSVARLLPPLGRGPQRGLAADITLEIALVRRGLGRMTEAAALLRRAIPRLAAEKDREGLQHAWWALAGAERFAGRYDLALDAFGRAARLAAANGDPSAEAYAWCGEAGCLRILGRWALSHEKYRRAHAYFVRAKDRFGEAYGLCGQGNALRAYGDPRKTLPLYRRSAALYADVGDGGSRAFALWGLGGSFRRLGRYDDALRHYRAALKDFQKVGDHRGVIMALLGLGRTTAEAGKDGSAFLRRALAHARAERHPYEAALAQLELARAAGRPPDPAPFRRFGVSPAAVRAWRDLP